MEIARKPKSSNVDVLLRNRKAYRSAASLGLAVTEAKRVGKRAIEALRGYINVFSMSK